MRDRFTVSVGDVIDNTVYDKVYGEEETLVRGMSFDEGVAYYSLQEHQEDYRIYVIRDGAVIFYVGKSVDIPSRLGEHLGLYGRFGSGYPDHIGFVIRDNLPESREWAVDLFTVSACREKLNLTSDDLRWWDVDLAEQQMIRALQPCVNVIHNEHGKRMPDKYTRQVTFVVGD